MVENADGADTSLTFADGLKQAALISASSAFIGVLISA
jgi:hypothetical protein